MKKDILIGFLSNLLAVILGIVITFAIQGMIDRSADRRGVRSALELVRTELMTNKEDLLVAGDFLRQEQASARYFLSHRDSLDRCPKDSLSFHSGILFSDFSITTCHDALELLKMSSLFQKIGDNPLSMKIIRAYDTCEMEAQFLNQRTANRNERFANSISEQNARRIAANGYIDIQEYLKTDFGLYVIRDLASQASPDSFTDISDIDEAIEAIGDYLSGHRTHAH